MNFKQLVLMNLQALTNFPYIEKDFDAVTDYELLCLVVDHLNEVIKNSNEQNTVIQNLYNAFVELKDYVDNYFKNLDVQEEVDNKLDEMAASGELADIIAQYLEVASVLGFDTKASLKSADNLVNGSITRTLGNHQYNDLGGAYYKIRTITSSDVIDDIKILALSNYPTLVAEMIKTSKMNVNQYGAYGDGIHDDTEAIQYAINDNQFGTIYFCDGTYLISDTIKTYVDNTKQCNINMEKNTVIRASKSLPCLIELGGLGGNNEGVNNRMRYISGGVIDALNCESGIKINENAMGITIKDLEIKRFSTYGIYVPVGNTLYSSDLLIDNCYINGPGSNYNTYGIYLGRPDNNIVNSRINAVKVCVRANYGGQFLNNVHGLGIGYNVSDNTWFNNTVFMHHTNGSCIQISNCYCDTFQTFVKSETSDDFNVNNSTFFSYLSNVDCILFDLQNSDTKYNIKNNTFDLPTPSSKHIGIKYANFNDQQTLNDYRVFIKDNILLGSINLNAGDLLLMTHKSYQPYWNATNNSLGSNNWLKIGYIIPSLEWNSLDLNIEGYHFIANFKLERYDGVMYVTQRASYKSNNDVTPRLGFKFIHNKNGYNIIGVYLQQTSGTPMKPDISVKQLNENTAFMPVNIDLIDPTFESIEMDSSYSLS